MFARLQSQKGLHVLPDVDRRCWIVAGAIWGVGFECLKEECCLNWGESSSKLLKLVPTFDVEVWFWLWVESESCSYRSWFVSCSGKDLVKDTSSHLSVGCHLRNYERSNWGFGHHAQFLSLHKAARKSITNPILLPQSTSNHKDNGGCNRALF